jgi:hypothetical protein
MPTDENDIPRFPHRQSLVQSWRSALTEHRWLRNTFTRQNIAEAAKNLAWVGPLTILIWVWAEREQTQEIVLNDVPVQVMSSDPSKFVKGDARVSLRLKGPQATLDRVRERLMAGIPRGLEVDVSNTLGRGSAQPVNVVDRIQNQPLFRDTGVTVTESQPAVIPVDVDDMAKRDLDVQLPFGVTNLTPATTFDPLKVTVAGPATALKRMEDQGELKVYADLSPGAEALRTPGKHDLPAVPVRLPPGTRDDRLTITPSTVHAVLDVRPADVDYTIPALPITVEATAAFWHKYDVIFPGGESIANINVSGPQQQIEQLSKGTYAAKAVLDVSRDDFGHEQPKPLEYHLGEGVHVKPEDANRTVEFKIVQRDSGNG